MVSVMFCVTLVYCFFVKGSNIEDLVWYGLRLCLHCLKESMHISPYPKKKVLIVTYAIFIFMLSGLT